MTPDLATRDDRLKYAVALASQHMPADLLHESMTLAQLSPDDAGIEAVDHGDGWTSCWWIGRWMCTVPTSWLQTGESDNPGISGYDDSDG